MELFVFLILVLVFIWCAVEDFRTLYISDAVLVGGTMLGVLLASVCPQFLYPLFEGKRVNCNTFLQYWNIRIKIESIWVPITCCVFILFAVTTVPLRRDLVRRFGVVRWFILVKRRYVRYLWFRRNVIIALLIGITALVISWSWNLIDREFCSTALLGAVFGLCLGWFVRIYSGHLLEVEAFGFGDVLMLGLIGAWIGWQLVIPVFIVSIPVGLAIALITKLLVAEFHGLAFGPALAIGGSTVLLIRDYSGFDLYQPIMNFFQRTPLGLLVSITVLSFALGWLLVFLINRLQPRRRP